MFSFVCRDLDTSNVSDELEATQWNPENPNQDADKSEPK